MEMRALTNQILRELIDHIDVYEVEGRGKNRTQRMVIYYKFVGYLEIPSHLIAPNYKADLRQGVAVEYVSCEPTDSARELFDEDCELVEEEQLKTGAGGHLLRVHRGSLVKSIILIVLAFITEAIATIF